jgi:hypothetical protein
VSRILLDLSRRYASGDLGLDAYREKRRVLVQRLVQATDDITRPADQFAKREYAEDLTQDYTPTKKVALKTSGNKRVLWAVSGLASLVGLGILVFSFSGPGDLSDAQSSSVAVIDVKESALQRQIRSLLNQDVLTPEQWLSMQLIMRASTDDEKVKAKSDSRYIQLRDRLDSQVQVLKALDPEGTDAEITDQISRLEKFRAQIF